LWASGYLAGMAHALAPAAPIAAPVVAAQPATIVYGSQTGNAKRAAEALLAKLQAANLPVRLLRADAYPLRELADETLLYVVVSTQGDGDPPDDARGFLEFVEGRRAPALKKLKFAVLALGDSSYPQFCAIGRRIDQRLQALGGERIAECADADLDIETVATPWTETVARIAADVLKPAAPLATVTPLRPLAAAVTPYSRAKPFAASVLANQRITFGAGGKDVRHLELALDGAGLAYEPGDALGLWPRNPEPLVDAVLQATALDGDTAVRIGEEERSLRAWLLDKRELTRLARPFVAAQAERSGNADLQRLLAPEHAGDFQQLLASLQPIDLLQRQRADWDAESLVAALRPLQPRLYSIASSRKLVGDEAHLTVAARRIRHRGPGALGRGLAPARHPCRRRHPAGLHRSQRALPPACRCSRDIIMIGAGTGVAPFRGFVQERAALGGAAATGCSSARRTSAATSSTNSNGSARCKAGSCTASTWRSRATAHARSMCSSASRAGARAVRLAEGGAHLYVCGATAMGKDVHAALIDALSRAQRRRPRRGAPTYLDTLARDGRYARDLY
jgi:sulfite reductase (NADPH) flavoprotein alpha-component